LQKVMIARALVQDTPIIILDEPTTFLDLENTFQIFELLKKIAQEQQKTIIFSTHQLEIALQICNQIVAFSNEEIIIQTPKQLIKNQYIQTIFNSEKIKFNPDLIKFEYRF
jgi:iron complex transport system ATP-binding protein